MLAVSLRRVVNWTSCSRPPFHSGSARTARECRPSHGGPSSRGTDTSMSRSPARARVHRPASPARSRRPEAPGATARITPSYDRWSHQLLRSRNPGDLPVPTRRRRGPAPEGSRDRIRRHRELRARRSKSWSLPSPFHDDHCHHPTVPRPLRVASQSADETRAPGLPSELVVEEQRCPTLNSSRRLIRPARVPERQPGDLQEPVGAAWRCRRVVLVTGLMQSDARPVRSCRAVGVGRHRQRCRAWGRLTHRRLQSHLRMLLCAKSRKTMGTHMYSYIYFLPGGKPVGRHRREREPRRQRDARFALAVLGIESMTGRCRRRADHGPGNESCPDEAATGCSPKETSRSLAGGTNGRDQVASRFLCDAGPHCTSRSRTQSAPHSAWCCAWHRPSHAVPRTGCGRQFPSWHLAIGCAAGLCPCLRVSSSVISRGFVTAAAVAARLSKGSHHCSRSAEAQREEPC